jgi:enamine deaminase RidA (YjgF/YER057c/UK114 family)
MCGGGRAKAGQAGGCSIKRDEAAYPLRRPRILKPSNRETRPMTPETKLSAMGLVLPEIPKPMGTYVPFKINGNTLYLSGQGPRRADGTFVTGKVGRDVTVEQAYEAAKLVGLCLLAAAKMAVGELSRIEVLKVLGMVNAVPEFGDQPKVINGCSDLFVAVLSERGRHARSAVGVGSLPVNISVEIEAVMRIHD